MYTYTTPTITCKFTGLNFEFLEFVRVAVKGNRSIIIRVIDPEDIDQETGEAVIQLTQQETAALGPGILTTQARAKYTDGTVVPTNQVRGTLDEIVDEAVI